MIIRSERKGDEAAIGRLITAAFLDAGHRDGTETDIVKRLRAAGALTLSLVAEGEGDLIGHVAFSPVAIDGEDRGWFGLGPVSVDRGHRRRGIAAALIEDGLRQLAQSGASGCVVLGEPAYYTRFGFAAGTGLRLAGVPPEYFMALAFAGTVPSGDVIYHPAFRG